MPPRTGAKKAAKSKSAETYQHPESTSPMRPEIGAQAKFKKKKEPQKYRYDDSLAPSLEWDGQNPARERGEARIAKAEQELAEVQKALAEKATAEGATRATEHLRATQDAVRDLKAMSRPFLNWAGKAERMSFEVPTLPLFIHERLSTKAILETLKGHKRDKQTDMFELFGDPQHSIVDQTLKAYEYPDKWVNRMILGDSLVVLNSLLGYESLGGQVQMVYIDPPCGVKFGSNFQPFVRSRQVVHSDDADMTREPETVQAYRDTWELGLHSYLTYLRDRFLVARDLLTMSGSIFVQISDDNIHHVRELMDEVFGGENFVSIVPFIKTASSTQQLLSSVADFILWYARDIERLRYNQLYLPKDLGGEGASNYNSIESPDGTKWRKLTKAERDDPSQIPVGWKIFSLDNLTSQRPPGSYPFEFQGQVFTPGKNYWKTHEDGMRQLANQGRLIVSGGGLYYKRYLSDFPVYPLANVWTDTSSSFMAEKLYVVQTTPKVIERCLLMSTQPSDLVVDPTCGSGTTAYVAEQWGRRWITCDTSRVPLALARQRLLTATFDFYELKDEGRGPAGGFVYKRKQNNKGEEVGGIVPHITLKSIANNEPPAEEVLVDKPEIVNAITRVTGPFCVEATIPTPRDWEEEDAAEGGGATQATTPGAAVPRENGEEHGSFVDRMIEVLRRSPLLRLEGNKTVTLKNVRVPAKTLSLSAEAVVDATATGRANLEEAVQEAREKSGLALPLSQKPVAIVFGPENGAVTESLVRNAHDEASMKSKGYEHLYVIGFAIEPNARQYVEHAAKLGVPATYVQATPDLSMGDLLKNMRSSQIFSVTGLPDVELRKSKSAQPGAAVPHGNGQMYEVELLGLDVFDPVNMEAIHRKGDDIPAWFLDTDYNGLCFHVSQAFFPKTGAWENLKKALKTEYEEGVWEHLAGTVSAPFEKGDRDEVAVKVIDDRGNELLVVKNLSEAK
jgi:adenine-specific DNA-methyltransferase